jgi:hypothetical protein
MRQASRILFSGLLGLALSCFVLATFAATKSKARPPAPTPQASAAPTAAVTPAAAAAAAAPAAPAVAPAAAPSCSLGAVDPSLTSVDPEARPMAGDNCSCNSYDDCVVCCEEEYTNFMCHTAHDKHGNPIYPGTCFCWNL